MTEILSKTLMVVFAVDIFALGVLILFFINARKNLKREITMQRYYFNAMTLARTLNSSEEAAQRLNVTLDEFNAFCAANNIETPEKNRERLDKEKKYEDEQHKRILEEEAAWRSEQERIREERRKAQEEEARKRKERLKKFGFK